ncbi:uncharacterized protein plekhg2 [Festucalex cinctus]
MPEGSRHGSSRSSSNAGTKRPSSVSSLSGIVGRMMSSGERGASSSSCTSVNTVCSDCERPASLSLSSSASSVSLQDASHSSSSSSSSSSLPYGAVPAYNAAAASSAGADGNGSDISLDLTPLVTGGSGRVAAATGPRPADPAAAPAPRRLSRLERVVMEIVETEQAYVRDLKSIVEDYLGCIIDCDALPVNPEQVSTLFCNIEDIYEFNSELLEDLERSQHAAAIADCFVERSEAFDIYTLYCMNYPNSVSVLRECMKNQSLVRFFHERQTTLNHSLPLEAYLLKPVQRILKYHLLLQELSKHLDKSDPGYEVVEDAIITMTAVAWYINDMKRKQEHAVRLQEIESLLVNWSGPDLSGFGELVLEASFKVQRVKKERAFFLFDKMLLIAKKRVESFVYSTHIFCCNLLLVDALKDPLCFRVSDQMIPKQQHVVQTKNMEEKRLWVHYLKKLIVENHPASLPHKARQVLGDNFCQSAPQFEQDHLKKFSSASPRLDNIHAYHRGRRQSEPPELLTYTPEKSRKSFPLLLEGNLPYRRTRRQSAPAKDIEAAFHHHHALKQADSEGQLNRADSLSSAGSSSTLASSVIQMESEQNHKQEQQEEEDDEEDLASLCAPPTLSITEEILEFINQSRAREALVSMEQVLDQPVESQPSPYESNFTCPLPPVASSPEEMLTLDPLQEEVETCQNQAAEEQTADWPKELESANVVHHVKVENGLQAEEEAQEEALEEEIDLRKTSEEGEHENILTILTPLAPPTEIPPSVSVMEDGEASSYLIEEEATDSPTNPDDGLGGSPSAKPKRASALTRHDKRIIEKIRSYYEAAAELEEDQEAEDAEPEENETCSRDTFSQNPSGLVKDSVSLITGDDQEGAKNESVETETGHHIEITYPAGPDFPELLEDSHEHEGHVDTLISLADLEAKDRNLPDKSPNFTRMEDHENPNEVLVDLPSTSVQPSEVEKEMEGEKGSVSNQQSDKELNEGAENRQQDENPRQEEGERNDTIKSLPLQLARTNETEWNQKESKEEKGILKESSTTLSNAPQSHKTWTRSKHKVSKTSRTLEELPSQIQLGRGCRQSRIVSTNRALFEGMVSDITAIGLFEASPVADPSLMENSERILSKVQTLASMYSAKAGTMKVPLHQKRAIFVRNRNAALTGLSSVSSQTQTQETKCKLEVRKQTKWDISSHAPPKISDSPIDAKPRSKCDAQTESQRFSQTKDKNNPITQAKNKLHVPANAQMPCERQNHTKTDGKNQNHTMNQEDNKILDVLKKAAPSDEPKSPCRLESHRFTLSRPRDFITALNKEHNSGKLDDKLESSVTRDARLVASLTTCSSQDKSSASRSELREEHVYTEDTASVNSIVEHSRLSSHIPHWNVSKEENGHDQYKQDLPAVQDKHDPQSQIPAKYHKSTRQPSKDQHSVCSGPEYLLCTGPRHGDSSPGEMIMLSSVNNLTAPQQQTFFVQKPMEECHKDALSLMGGRQPVVGVPRGSSNEDLPSINKSKCELNSFSQPTWKCFPDKKVPGPTLPRQPREGPNPLLSMQVLESNGHQSYSPMVESHDCLTKFTSQKPLALQAMSNTGKVHFSTSSEFRKPDQQGPGRPTNRPILGPPSGCRSPPRAVLDVFCQVEPSSPLMVTSDKETHLGTFRHTSPSSIISPNPTPSSVSARAPTCSSPSRCSSPFRVIPLSSPTPLANEGFVSPDIISRTHPSFSAPPSSVRSFSKSSPPASSPTHSSALSPTSSKGAGPSSPIQPLSLRSPPCSSPVASSSTFTRSLAASCISQTLAKKNNTRHQVQSSHTPSPSSVPSSHLRRCSPSPRLSHSQEVSSALTSSHSIDRNLQCPPSPLRSTCPSPSSAHSTLYSNSQNASSSYPFKRAIHHQPLSSTSAHHYHQSLTHNVELSQNANIILPTSYNCGLSSEICSPSPPKVKLANVSSSITALQQTGDRLSFGSHNRIARPFSASEPNSRVQSPSTAVSPPSFTRLCSPPPQHNSVSAMVNKPPHPRCSRTRGASSHNPLGLTLKIPDASSTSLTTGPAAPQILSPPAIGVSLWTCNVTTPQPRNPQFISPPCSCSSCSGLQNANFSTPTSVLLRSSEAGSPHGHPNKPLILQRSLSNLSDTSTSPVQREACEPHSSWAERSHGFTDTFDQRESGLASPTSRWSSFGGSSSCLSPRGGLQSPASPRRFTPGRSDSGLEHLSSDPSLDGQLLGSNYHGRDGFHASGTSTGITSTYPLTSLSQSLHSPMAANYGDPQLEQESCRSQLICAYLSRPPSEPDFASSSYVVRSSPPAAHRQIYQAQLQSPPQATHVRASVSSPATFACPSPSKVSNQRTSYATTVNLQIAGSGRITSFSTAHVSVSQTPADGAANGEIHNTRRVSMNGLSHVSSVLPHNYGQLYETSSSHHKEM